MQWQTLLILETNGNYTTAYNPHCNGLLEMSTSPMKEGFKPSRSLRTGWTPYQWCCYARMGLLLRNCRDFRAKYVYEDGPRLPDQFPVSIFNQFLLVEVLDKWLYRTWYLKFGPNYLCLIDYCGDVLFCWRLVFSQVIPESCITLESVWQVFKKKCTSVRSFVKLTKMPTLPLLLTVE